MSECERKCTYCETWTRGWIAVCSDCHGERTDALCRRKRAERQVAAVEKAMLMMRVREDFLRASHRMDEATIAEACVFDIRRALETE